MISKNSVLLVRAYGGLVLTDASVQSDQQLFNPVSAFFLSLSACSEEWYDVAHTLTYSGSLLLSFIGFA